MQSHSDTEQLSNENLNTSEALEEDEESAMKLVYRFIQLGSPCKFYLSVGCGLVAGVSYAFISLWTVDLLDWVLKKQTNVETEDNNNIFWQLGLMVFIFFSFRTTAYITANYATIDSIKLLREKFLRSALKQEMTYHDTETSAKLSATFSGDSKVVISGMSAIPITARFFTQLLASMIVGFQASPAIMGICLGFIAFINLIIYALYVQFAAIAKVDSYKNSNADATELFGAIRTVVCVNGADFFCERFSHQAEHGYELERQKIVLDAISMSIFFSAFAGMQILGYTSAWALDVTFVDFQVAVTACVTILFSASFAASQARNVIESIAATRRLFAVVDREPKRISTPTPIEKKLDGNVEFEQVSFCYPMRPNQNILRKVSFKITSGQTIALVGESGAGKSTIMRLLQRFYDLQKDDGTIKLDDHNITDYELEHLYDSVGVVDQQPVLFSMTIEENILLGLSKKQEKELSDEEKKKLVIESMKKANAHDFVMEFENGYATNTGERGMQLSGGQKQRIAIARALVKQPEILLLDEATSALDTASELKVQKAIDNVLQTSNVTCIVIAHRLSTIKNADCIYVFKKGKIVESGNHEDLIENGRAYYEMVEGQALLTAD